MPHKLPSARRRLSPRRRRVLDNPPDLVGRPPSRLVIDPGLHLGHDTKQDEEELKNDLEMNSLEDGEYEACGDTGWIVMTRGPKGVFASNGKTLWKAGIFPEKKVVDRTGAGDAFGAGFAVGLIRSKGDVLYALRLGSANATSKVEHQGAKGGLLTRDEFENDSRWNDLPIEIKELA